MLQYLKTITPSFILFLLVFFSLNCNSQILETNRLTTLRLYEGDTITFLSDSLFVDTLLMDNNSVIQFKSDVYFFVKNAFIGNSANIINVGLDGGDGKNGDRTIINGTAGSSGSDGSDIILAISFFKLGSLRISTDGGAGGKGGNGFSPPPNESSGERGFDGGNGGASGKGGNAGNITINYKAVGFIPLFDNTTGKNNSIILSARGGDCGKSGSGGKGGKGGPSEFVRGPTPASSFTIPRGQNGDNGFSGAGCGSGKSGKLIINRIDNR